MELKAVSLAIFLVLFSFGTKAAENDFPIPDSIRPAINFWVRVYTEADTSSGFLHDSKNLGVVYQKLDRDRDLIKKERESIQDDLRVLASGERDDLTASQRKILALWPEGVSNERLADAAKSVRWQLGQADRFAAGLKRSGAYRQHIEEVVLSKGLPIELAALPHVESSFHPGAYSSAAATGMWQFVRATAVRFMQVDYVVDERLDPYAATNGAMSLLEYNYNVLGSWPLALTAYNHGANGMARAVRDMGTSEIGRIISDYKGSRFGFASRNFYPQFLAVQEVEKNIEKYYGSIEFDERPSFAEHELTAFVGAEALADSMQVSLNTLKRDNPALQPSVWSGTKRIPKGYKVKINRKNFQFDLASSVASLPASELFGDQIPDLSYVVRRGDSLSVISDRFDTSVSELVAINQLRDRHRIRVGQTLLLPQIDGSVPTLLVAQNSKREIPADGRYEVQRGDTISTISERFTVPMDAIMAFNSLKSNSIIYPGQNLLLKSSQTVQLAGVNPAEAEPKEESAEELNSVSALEPAQVENIDVASLDQGLINTTVTGIDSDSERGQTLASLERAPLQQLSVDSNSRALEVSANIEASEQEAQLSQDLASDPSNYSVSADATIEVQAVETLGHYAEWLGIRAQDIRRLNSLPFGRDVLIGGRLKLDFSKVNVDEFEKVRREFHRNFQTTYFSNWRIENTEEYTIQRNDLLGNLARKRSIPMWLFRQYNPEIDAGRLQIGQVIVFPVVARVTL